MSNQPEETERSNVVAIRRAKTEHLDEAVVRGADGARTAGAHAAHRSHPSVDAALAALSAEQPEPVQLTALQAIRPAPSSPLRVALAAAAFGQLIVGVAWLENRVPFGRIVGSPTAAHLSRDAALGVVLGIIGIIVAWRPRWSLSLVPVVGAIVAVQTVGLIADAGNDQRGFHFEVPHLLAIAVGVLIFLSSRRRDSVNL